VGEPDRAPDLRDVYAFVNAGWRRHAVCAEEDDVNFWPDENLQRYTRHLGSAVALLPLLICEACPVRVDCLREGLTRFPAPMQDAETSSGRGAPVRLDVRSVGVWGGSMDVDRFHVAHLPREAAIAELERTFRSGWRSGSGHSRGPTGGESGTGPCDGCGRFSLLGGP
jgi:hypothetical protein